MCRLAGNVQTQARVISRQVVLKQLRSDFFYPMAVAALGHNISALLQRSESICNRNRATALGQESMIVFGVAQSNDIVGRKPQFGHGGLKPGSFVYAGGQYHHRSFVEYDLKLEAEIANGIQYDILMRLPRRHDAASHRCGHSSFLE